MGKAQTGQLVLTVTASCLQGDKTSIAARMQIFLTGLTCQALQVLKGSEKY